MSALARKRILGSLLGRKRAAKRDVILIYHSVAGGALSVPETAFCLQMAWLKDNAHVVTLDELLDVPNSGGLRVVLSFDDGYSSLLDTIHPILATHAFPAIVYLNSGLLGDDRRFSSMPELGHYPDEHFLTWDEVAYLVQNGWTAGGHGVDHIDLTMTSAEETQRQLVDCKAQLEARLGVSCSHFAYTWGHYNDQVRVAVASAGFSSAVAGLHGPVTLTSDHFALPRVDMRADYELRDFIDVVTGQWDFIGLKQRLVRKLS
jgi:peptidoglycan/xylan/chitin deacetylase (PgdA/CDA1 family)